MKKNYMLIMIFSIFFVSCQSSGSEYGPCGEFKMPRMDKINVNEIIYFSYPHLSEIAINPEDISLEITDIKRKVSKPSECTEATLTDDSQDGDATQLTKGTKIYQHKHYHPTFRVVAKVKENTYRLYEVIQNPSAKTFGDYYKIKDLVQTVYLSTHELNEMDAKKFMDAFLSNPINNKKKPEPEPNDATYFDILFKDGTEKSVTFFPKSKMFHSSIVMSEEFYIIYQEVWGKLQLEKERKDKESAD